jgi:hypothetical protein
MADQIVITEKTSQAKDVRAAAGSRYGNILPAEGICSTCSSRRMLYRPGSAGHRPCCSPKGFTALARSLPGPGRNESRLLILDHLSKNAIRAGPSTRMQSLRQRKGSRAT